VGVLARLLALRLPEQAIQAAVVALGVVTEQMEVLELL
tara:strand:+ start:633 stop:746 length:114 start_codon:yes stop_codon:yes gene_type:complete